MKEGRFFPRTQKHTQRTPVLSYSYARIHTHSHTHTHREIRHLLFRNTTTKSVHPAQLTQIDTIFVYKKFQA